MNPSRSAAILLFFALSFTLFAIQSGDVLMYLTLVRDFLSRGEWPAKDPFLYSLPNAELHIAHEYLSYFIFYGAWLVAGFAGLIFLKILVLAALFALVLYAGPREKNASALWMGLWLLAVLAASFRFIERTSLFSDLFSVLLIYWLLEAQTITRGFIIRLTALFLIWVNLHPGYPVGIILLAVWTAWHSFKSPTFARRRIPWLLLPLVGLLANPLFLDGALYPIRFALNEAQVLKLHNFEWFPTYHPAFRFTPEVIGYWGLLIAVIFILTREKAWLSLRALLSVIVMLLGIQAVRFVPWTSFALLILIKPYADFRIGARWLKPVLATIMLAIAIKNLDWGYQSSSGPRLPRLALDRNFFPIDTVEFLKAHPIPGTLYNAQDFGNYLVWEKMTPIFHHGFVTDMEFYEKDAVGVFHGPDEFKRLAQKYGWTKLLVDKHGSYPYFYKILSPMTEWKIVAEDDASYLIYLLPNQ